MHTEAHAQPAPSHRYSPTAIATWALALTFTAVFWLLVTGAVL